MRKNILIMLAVIFSAIAATAQNNTGGNVETFVFTFKAGDAEFLGQLGQNNAEIERLFKSIDQRAQQVAISSIPIGIESYAASLGSASDNTALAQRRSRVVKSFIMIKKKGVGERNFRTRNMARAYEGRNDVVVITLQAAAGQASATPQSQPEKAAGWQEFQQQYQNKQVAQNQQQAQAQQQQQAVANPNKEAQVSGWQQHQQDFQHEKRTVVVSSRTPAKDRQLPEGIFTADDIMNRGDNKGQQGGEVRIVDVTPGANASAQAGNSDINSYFVQSTTVQTPSAAQGQSRGFGSGDPLRSPNMQGQVGQGQGWEPTGETRDNDGLPVLLPDPPMTYEDEPADYDSEPVVKTTPVVRRQEPTVVKETPVNRRNETQTKQAQTSQADKRKQAAAANKNKRSGSDDLNLIDTRFKKIHNASDLDNDYSLAFRINALYTAALTPTVGLEWRVSPSLGVKMDVGLSYWGEVTGNVHKVQLFNPELRYYMGRARDLYVGLGGNYVNYNAFGGVFQPFFPEHTGYQGTLWNAGVVFGYQLKCGRRFAIDFNIGLGYTETSYDSFMIENDARILLKADESSSMFGPTQAGITLVWKL